MRRLLVTALVVALVGMAGMAQSAEKEKAKKKARERANPTGTWTWAVKIGEQTREMTLKLKLDGDKLTGAMVGRDGQETKIEDAKYQKGTLSFTVVRERGGVKMTSKYTGRVSADAIKGKISVEREGKTESRDWDAKRVKPVKEKA